MAGTIPDELMLARLRKERLEREQDLADLSTRLDGVVKDFEEKIEKLQAKTRALLKGQAIDSDALISTVQRVVTSPGFALAEKIEKLEAEVSSKDVFSQATIEEIRRTIATLEYSLAEDILALKTSFSDGSGVSMSTLTSILTSYATTGFATSIAATQAAAAVGSYAATANAQLSALATADGRLSGQYALRLDAGGRIAGMTVTAADGLSGGTGYTSAPSVSFETQPGDTGSGAAGTATVSGGVVTGVVVTNPGSGYKIPPKVVLSGGGGTGAKAVSTILAGGVFQVLTQPTSEVAFNADVFKIWNGAGTINPFTLVGSTLTLDGTLVVNGTSTDLATIANNASLPPINYIGEFAVDPASGPLAINSVYRNTTDGNLYIRTNLATWALYFEAGTPGLTGHYFDYRFKRAAIAPSAPSGDTPAGWFDAPPAADGNPLWMIKGEKTASGSLVGTWSAPVQLDGSPGLSAQIEYSVDGLTSWHPVLADGDLYIRQRVGTGAWSGAIRIVGEQGAQGNFIDNIFIRSATQPATPTGGSPAGWSDAPPADDGNPLWMSFAEKTYLGVLVGTWSTPVKLGGQDGSSVNVEYSVDGLTSWHSVFATGDLYMRQRVGTGNPWSAAIRIVGEAGAAGASVQVEYSADGISGWHSTFVSGSDFYMHQRVGTGAWSAAIRIVGATGATGAAGTPGTRGSKAFYTSGSSWSDATADNAIASAGLTKVSLDQVTISNGSTFAETRYWSGTAWLTISAVINGNLLVNGAIGTQHLVAGIGITTPSINGGAMTGTTLDVGSNENRVRINSSGLTVGLVTVNGASNQNTINIGATSTYSASLTGGAANASLVLSGVGSTTSLSAIGASLTLGGVQAWYNSGGIIRSDANIKVSSFYQSSYNIHPSSTNQIQCGEDGGTPGLTTSGFYLAMRFNGRTIWVPFWTSLP